MKPLPRYVYGVVDDCPAEWGDKAVLGLFWAKRDARDFALKTKGADPVSGQYIEVQKWRIK